MIWVVFCGSLGSLGVQERVEILAMHPLYTRADAQLQARRWGGPRIAEVPDRGAAEAMVAALQARGLDAFSVARGALIPNPAPQAVRNADCLEAGLEIEPPTGPRCLVPWSAFLLLTGGVLRSNPRQYYLDAYVRALPPHLRFLSGEFNFDYLGARKAAVSRANFRCLVEDLAGHAHGARKGPAVEALVGGDFDAVPVYDSLAEFEEWNHFELAMIQRESAAAAAGTDGGDGTVEPADGSEDLVP